MMSTLEEGIDNLTTVQYKDLLELIAQTLGKNERLISIPSSTIVFDIDRIAQDVATQIAASNKYPFANRDGTTYASIHLPDIAKKEAFSDQVELVVYEIQKSLQAKLGSRSIGEYATSLLKPVSDFSGEAAGLHYPLGKAATIEKQRLHLSPKKTGDVPWLKGHKLTLHVKDIKAFDTQLISGICSYIEHQNVCDEEEVEETREVLEAMAKKAYSPFSRLRAIVIKESLARIQREAKVKYLHYLYRGIGEWKAAGKEEGMKLLGNLIRRLRMLDAYIRQEKDDASYKVTYQDNIFNYRDLFSRADAFDMLPIITEVEGFLGESTNREQGAKTFVSGLKLKLNGQVQVHGGKGKSAYEYYLALLNSDSQEYRDREADARSSLRFQEKVLKVVLLYYFVFVEMTDASFQPAESFETEILNVLRTGTEAEKRAALQALQRKIDVQLVKDNIRKLKELLVSFLDHQSIGPAPWEETLVLSLKESVLVKNVDSMVTHNIFFQEGFDSNGGLDALKYIAVEAASTSKGAICKLPLSMIFEPMYYYSADDDAEKFTMAYETEGVQVLPIFLAPIDGVYRQKYSEIFRNTNLVVFYYRHRPEVLIDSARAFIHRFTYMLLAYVFLKMLADSMTSVDKRKLFFPIICLHAVEKAVDEQSKQIDDEMFMHYLSKILAHMLAEDYASNSQGFHLSTVQQRGQQAYKLQNALNSLYSALPRRFRLNGASPSPASTAAATSTLAPRQLEKLAIIMVSSRKCDVNFKVPDYYKATVFGEVVGIERLSGGDVRVGMLSTFSINQTSEHMYTRPEAIIEQVKTCYAKGYRHFVYVAHAPYSSTLHISDAGSDEELFFMNKDIIQAVREVDDAIRIYPVFCDKYYVVNRRRHTRKPLQVDSLYIDDIGELSKLVVDPSKRSLVFFNLFNGASVTKQVYNGVMSYATLINVYHDDPTYDQYIWSDILGEHTYQSLKTDILDFITLLHFSRYEKPRDQGFKLDPYKRIIGDNSVGKIAILPHMNGKVHFNALAFLTLVRAVLNTKR
jgi:hypothetical protein